LLFSFRHAISFVLISYYYLFLVSHQESAGNTKRRDHTKAYLSFIEAAESFDFGSMGNRTKRNDPSKIKELYRIAFQLLEAQDEALLHLAAECLIKIGDYEFIHGARALELYARLSYAQNNRAKVMPKKYHIPAAPTPREQSHFELAAKLYTKLMTDSKQSIRIYRAHVVNVVRNYLSTGLEEFIMAAADCMFFFLLFDVHVSALKDADSNLSLPSSFVYNSGGV